MPKKIDGLDIVGNVFGKLTVVNYIGKSNPKNHTYEVKCECGQTKIIKRNRLLAKDGTLSCGNCIFGNLIGKKFGRLTVIADVDLRNKRRFFKVKCDCGKEKEINGTSLLFGHTIKSCGCLLIEFNSTLSPGEACYNSLYYYYIKSASKRKHEFDLNKTDFIYFINSNCYYCGVAPCRIFTNRGKYSIYRNGIDRVNNSEGYVKDNCVSCCFVCNRSKGKMSQVEFLAHIKRIYDYSIKK